MNRTLQKNSFKNIIKSKFVRSISIKIMLVFLMVIIGIIVIVFFSFASEINKSIIQKSETQLEMMENTISKRMEEVAEIAYNVGQDRMFYTEKVAGDNYSGYEMSNTLARYLVGNDFIQYLAYYRRSEPDTIYASCGEHSFHDFFSTYLEFDNYSQSSYLTKVMTCNTVKFIPPNSTQKYKSFFTYVYALPQFSQKPQAYIIMLIPVSEVQPTIDAQLANCNGQITIFDASGEEIYEKSNLTDAVPDDLLQTNSKYVFQSRTSKVNGWKYNIVIQKDGMISDSANRQLILIVLLLILVIFAIFAILIFIVKQYIPINNLAMSINEAPNTNDKNLLDEESVLKDRFTTLKDDSDQKQKFEMAFYEAEAANKAKSTFLSNMSHDIRTPMNAIVGMTEIAKKSLDDPKYVKECLQKVSISSQYLLDIINNVLDMSRIESGKFTLSEERIELSKLIYGVITILNQGLKVKNLRFVVNVDEITNENVIGDNVRLTQVFMNILSNSVKFTPNGGTIRLVMHETPSEDPDYSDYTFVFSDTGIGMSEQFITQVFDTFTRDDNLAITKIEGTGLGMAIAKNFVELMGGTITCESKLGKGTSFTIKLHMKLDEERVSEISHEYDNKKMIIISDDMRVSESQTNRFKKLGAQVLNTLDINEAVDRMGPDIDFVIINQTKRDLSGMKTVKRLKEVSDSEDNTYVLAAMDFLSIEQSAAYNEGITDFVQIPIFRSTALGILNRAYTFHKEDMVDEIINLEGVHILLVEDNDINRYIANKIIRETKADICEATNGQEAVESFLSHDVGYFDLILMDVQMPVMSGYEATQAIRSMQRKDAKSVPIYAMTANTFDEDVRQVTEAGMDGHLGKPYTARDLYDLLQHALQR